MNWVTLRIFLVFGLILSLCSSMIVSARAVASRQSSAVGALFTDPNGSFCEMPCIFGIRPGKTKFGAALTMLQEHPVTYNLRVMNLVAADPSGARSAVFIGSSGGIYLDSDTQPDPVVRIVIILFSLDKAEEYLSFWTVLNFGAKDVPSTPTFDRLIQAAKLGDVLEYFGSPSDLSAHYTANAKTVDLYYPQYQSVVTPSDTQLRATIDYWAFYTPLVFGSIYPDNRETPLIPWQGLPLLRRVRNCLEQSDNYLINPMWVCFVKP